MTYTGIGVATRGAGAAAKKAGLAKNITSKMNSAAKKVAEKTSDAATKKMGWMESRMRATPSALIGEADDPAKALEDFYKAGGTKEMLDKPIYTLASFNIPWASWIPGLKDTKLAGVKEITSKKTIAHPYLDDGGNMSPPGAGPGAPPPGAGPTVPPAGPVTPPVAPQPVAPAPAPVAPAIPQSVAPQPAAQPKAKAKKKAVDPLTHAFTADELMGALKYPEDDPGFDLLDGLVRDAVDVHGGKVTLKQMGDFIDAAKSEGLGDDDAIQLHGIIQRAQEFVPTKKNKAAIAKEVTDTVSVPENTVQPESVVDPDKVGVAPETAAQSSVVNPDISGQNPAIPENQVSAEIPGNSPEVSGQLADTSDPAKGLEVSSVPSLWRSLKFGEVIPKEKAGEIVAEIRAGNAQSKNKGMGRDVPENISEDLVLGKVPTSIFDDVPDEDYGNYLGMLKATTDQPGWLVMLIKALILQCFCG